MMIQSRTVCGKSRRVHSVTCSLMEECALALTLHIFFSTVSRLVFKKYLKFRCKFRVERTHKRHAQLKWEAANEWEEIGPGCWQLDWLTACLCLWKTDTSLWFCTVLQSFLLQISIFSTPLIVQFSAFFLFFLANTHSNIHTHTINSSQRGFTRREAHKALRQGQMRLISQTATSPHHQR